MSTQDSRLSAAANPKVVVATTVALSFISFWRGASIVLSDLASSMFYAGGAAEAAVGKAAPWFVLGVMLFSFAVRSVYMESCGMFVRGGVYVVVHDSMGPIAAKFSVSSLVFDYILTGPISVVSAGQYLGALLNEVFELLHQPYHVDVNLFAAGAGIICTIYFWWENIKGMHESSGKALRIMQITSVMVGILLIWCPITILLKNLWGHLPPTPTPGNITFSPEAQGWFKGTFWLQVPVVVVVIAFGHSLLSMSGFETLAQIYREIAYPKLKNLRITANITCWYAVVCTGIITVFAAIIIPDDIRPKYYDNLIGGLAMNLSGPYLLRLGFHAFVVLVGGLILAGAVNTSIIGANGVLNRVAEDGVLLPWFRRPHSRYGTTYRMINMIVIMQILTIIGSRGDMTILAEAYAFGVVWSFFMKSLGVLVLRYQRSDQEYKVPFNIRLGGVEIPIGLGVTTAILGFVAVANLFSKQIATKWGIAFTILFFILFTISEKINKRHADSGHKPYEEFNLDHQAQIDASSIHARAGCILVAARDAKRMDHLKRVLEKTNLRRHDIVVMTVRQLSTGAAEFDLSEKQLFSDYERELFTHVVEVAEKEGKPVELLVMPALDPFDAMAQAASSLRASRLVTGVSARMSSEELAKRIGLAWERLPEPRHPFSLEIISADRPSMFVNLGPHPPRLWPEDVDLLHDLWLELSEHKELGSKLHHRDVVGVALRRLQREMQDHIGDQLITEIRSELHHEDLPNAGDEPAEE
jgi:amino acid transporter